MNTPHIPHIVIIGAGFSGTVLSLQLIKKFKIPIKISIVEKSSKFARGIAYGTSHPKHLLNVPVENMGALKDDPLHFYNWIQENPSLWKSLDPEFQKLEIIPGDFVPRMIYGAYLEVVWNETLSQAKKKNHELLLYHDEAINLEVLDDKSFNTTFLSGLKLTSDYAVLTAGVPENKVFKLNIKSGDTSHYIKNIWSEKLPEFKPHATIVMIGTGLTMIDALMSSADAINPTFIAISKHGKLPEVHLKNLPKYPIFIDENQLPKTALELFRIVRKEIKHAASIGCDWRSVLDSLRPLTVTIWKNLNLKEKKIIYSLISSIWNTHRHRRPDIYREELKKLKIIAGTIDCIEVNKEGPIKIKYQLRGKSDINEIRADYVINCAGAELELAKNSSLLFKNLTLNHLILPDPLNLGLQADFKGRVLGNGKGKFFAIGLILTGSFFETIAVPELRVQCDVVAEEILNDYAFSKNL